MNRLLLFALAFICLCRFNLAAQAPNLPTKGGLRETLLSGQTFSNSSQVDTVLRLRPVADNYTLEVVAKVHSATGRGLDIEARNAALQGFRLSLDAATLNWTSTLSQASAMTASNPGIAHTIRVAVAGDSAHIYQNGAFIQTQPLSAIKDISGGVESSTLLNTVKGPTLIANWAGTAPNNMGRPSDYGWAYTGASTTTLFNTANSGSGVRYMDISAASGSNVHTFNGSTYTGRVLFIRWDGSGYQNAVFSYPVTLEANSTYDFSMLHAYVANAAPGKKITVGIGKSTGTSGRIASKVFTTSGTKALKRENFVFTSQEAGTYYLTFTGEWALYSIAELSLNKIDALPRFIFGKNYPSGAVSMEISSATYEEGVFAPAALTGGPRQTVTVSSGTASYLTSFNTAFLVPGKTDLHLSAENTPLVNSTVELGSEDSWLFFDNIKPSVVKASWLPFVTINGAPAANHPDVRIAIYKNGTVVIPNGNVTSTKALEVFTGPSLAGDSKTFEIETYHDSLGTFDNVIRSFKLKRGYMATLASNADGSGFSQVFVANDGDLLVSTLPQGLDGTVSFIRVFRWDWISKKGKAGWSPDKIGATWYYDWNIGGGAGTNYDYSLIRQNGGWPSWTDINNKKNVNHLLGFNEPDRPDQANMTVEETVAQWPELMKSGLRIGSPAPANPESSWITNFLAKTDSLNYRVDYVAIHCYWGGQTPQQWYNRLKNIYNRVKRPLWITEWNNGANWTTESWPSDPQAQLEKQYNDMKGILEVLDTASFVERYAIYDWVENKRAMVLADTLTPAGKYYYANKSDFAYNPQVAFVHRWKLVGPPPSAAVNQNDYYKVTLSWKDLNGEMGSKYILERKIDGTDTDFTPLQEFTGYPIGGTMKVEDSIYIKASYRIIAYNKAGDQFATSRALDVLRDAAPVAPSSLTGTVLSSSKTTLAWNAAAGARSYNLKRSLSPDGPFETITARTNELAYADKDLVPSTDYYYVVTALNSAGESAPSTALKLRTKDLVAPVNVLNPRIASGDSRLTLTWDFQYDAVYEIFRSESPSGPFEVIATGVDTIRFEDPNKINDKAYYYKVVAYNAAGRSPESSILEGMPVYGQHLHFAFNEVAGTFAEEAWGGYHGTLSSGAVWSGGKENTTGAVHLAKASSGYVTLPNAPVSSLNDFTVATWVKLPSVLSNNTRIFDFGTGTGTFMMLTPKSGTTMRYKITCPKGTYDKYIPQVLPLNEWVHIAIAQQGQTFTVYVNGDQVYTDNNATIKPSDMGITTQNYLGKSQYGSDPYSDLTMDDFRIYNYGVSASEVQDLFAGRELKRPQTITFNSITPKQKGDADFDPSAMTSSGLAVSYTSSNPEVAIIADGKVHITGAGTTDITAMQQGNDRYLPAAPVTQQLTVHKPYFVDRDRDGFGTGQAQPFATESVPEGYAVNNSDCDDSQVLYADEDGDGLGAGAPVACGVSNQQDCDDTNPVALTARIPDVYAVNSEVDSKNTLYIGYGPTSLTLSAETSGGRAPYTFTWNNGTTTQDLSVSQGGTYTVTITDQKGCNTTTSVTISTLDVTCGQNSDKVMICHNGNSICVASSSVQAHLNHGDNLGVCATITSAGKVGAPQETAAYILKVSPNPAVKVLTIQVSQLFEGATALLYNSHGGLVRIQHLRSSIQGITLSGLTPGIYYLKVLNGKTITTEKIVKQ